MPRDLTTTGGPNSVWDFMSEMERAFDDFWRIPMEREDLSRATFTPAVDLRETDDFYLVSVDVPGVNPKDIRIDVQNGRLSISGERSSEEKKESKGFRRFERSFGRFERSFQLPQNIDEEKIQARTENGVLEIMLPKSEVAKPKQVQINAEKGGLFSKLLGQKKVGQSGPAEREEPDEASRLKEKH